MNDSFARRDWHAWGSYLDEDVVVESALSPNDPIVGREAFVRFAAAAANQRYVIQVIDVNDLDDRHAHVVGSVQSPAGARGFKQRTVHWLMRFENDRLVRSYLRSSRAEVDELYQESRSAGA